MNRRFTVALLLAAACMPACADNALRAELLSRPHVDHGRGVIALPGITFSVIRGYRPLQLTLYVSTRTQGPAPIVMYVHGGGWAVDPEGSEMEGLTGARTFAELAARGYLVAKIGYRLSSEAKFPAAIQDVKAAVQWLRAHAAAYGGDPDRIAAWGSSAGGHLAALLGTSCGAKALDAPAPSQAVAGVSNCVQAVIDWYGPIAFASMDAQASPASTRKHGAADSAESSYLGCALPQCPKALVDSADATTYLPARAPPFLIMHGTADSAVPYQQSKQLYDALQAQNISAELVLVPGAEHLFKGIAPDRAQALLQRVHDFLDAQFKKSASSR